MIKRSYSLISPVTLGLLAGIGLSGVQLNAQQPSDQPPSPPSQQQAAPDAESQSQQAQVQTFAGTIMKSGDTPAAQTMTSTAKI
jgi:hypothetical protein